MSSDLLTEATLTRMTDDLASVVQALHWMSDAQRQHGEQLAQVITLLTPEPAEPGPGLGDLLEQLVGRVGRMGGELRGVGEALEDALEQLPGQMAAAIDAALARAEKRAAATAAAGRASAPASRR